VPPAAGGVNRAAVPNVETVAITDLRPATLVTVRNIGTVRNLRDRRDDLYGVVWRGS